MQLLFIFVLVYADISQEVLKVHETHEVLICMNKCKNLMGKNVHTMTRNEKYILIARQEIGLEISTAQTNYMLMFHEQNTGQESELQDS
jgi:hypothetical protein